MYYNREAKLPDGRTLGVVLQLNHPRELAISVGSVHEGRYEEGEGIDLPPEALPALLGAFMCIVADAAHDKGNPITELLELLIEGFVQEAEVAISDRESVEAPVGREASGA